MTRMLSALLFALFLWKLNSCVFIELISLVMCLTRTYWALFPPFVFWVIDRRRLLRVTESSLWETGKMVGRKCTPIQGAKDLPCFYNHFHVILFSPLSSWLFSVTLNCGFYCCLLNLCLGSFYIVVEISHFYSRHFNIDLFCLNMGVSNLILM